MELITITCRENCFGISGYHGSCCRLENRHFIIGPISDPEEFLARVNKHYDSNFSFSDIFIEYEEGKDLFPDKINWQKIGRAHVRTPVTDVSRMPSSA